MQDAAALSVFANIKSQILLRALRAAAQDLFIYSFRRCATNFFYWFKEETLFFLSLTRTLGSDAK